MKRVPMMQLPLRKRSKFMTTLFLIRKFRWGVLQVIIYFYHNDFMWLVWSFSFQFVKERKGVSGVLMQFAKFTEGYSCFYSALLETWATIFSRREAKVCSSGDPWDREELCRSSTNDSGGNTLLILQTYTLYTVTECIFIKLNVFFPHWQPLQVTALVQNTQRQIVSVKRL